MKLATEEKDGLYRITKRSNLGIIGTFWLIPQKRSDNFSISFCIQLPGEDMNQLSLDIYD